MPDFIIAELIGIVFLLAGFYVLITRRLSYHRCTSIVLGKVKDVVRHDDKKDPALFSLHPVFEYAVDGKVYTKESLYGSSKCKFTVGQSVEVRYNPNNPEEYYVDLKGLSNVIAMCLIILSIIIIILGFAIYM